MKLFKLNCVKTSVIIAIFDALIAVSLMSSLSLLVVDNISDLTKNAIIVVTLYLLKHAFYALDERGKAVGNYYLKLQLNHWMDNFISKKTYQDFKCKDCGEYASLYVNDIPKIINLMFNRLVTLFYNGTLCLFVLVALYKIHWIMLVMGIAMICVMSIFPMLFSKKLNKAILKSQDSQEKFLNKTTELMQGFGAFLENKAFNLFFKKSNKISVLFAKSICEVDSFAGVMSAVIDFMGSLTSTISLVLLSYLVIQKQVPAGSLLATISLMPALGTSTSEFISNKVFYKSGEKLFNQKFCDVETEFSKEFCKPFFYKSNVSTQNKNIDKPIQKNTIKCIKTRKASVHYENQTLNFKNYVFEFPKKYAIIGESGSGKSTLLKLILGEIETYNGDILVNDIVKGKKDNLFDDIAYVNQNTFLLNDTLYNNITLGKDIEREKINAVLKRVSLSNFNLDYLIQENGKNISGGQRQRIALARAIALDKKIIFLDEATANLDRETADFIENSVLEMDCMVLMITHHLSDEIKQKLDELINITSD
ncbi:MAG: ABC transporter ATP-binding protein [Longicatena sp.]